MLPFDENERILYEVRKHWFVILYPTLFTAVAILAPVVMYISAYMEQPMINEYLPLFLFVWAIWSLVWWMFWFLRWTDYFLDVWYITNKRIVDVEQRGVFHRVVSTLRYEKVQDITFEVKGMVPTFMGFGDVHVQTAGEDQEIIIRHAKNPEDVKQKILAELDRVEEK